MVRSLFSIVFLSCLMLTGYAYTVTLIPAPTSLWSSDLSVGLFSYQGETDPPVPWSNEVPIVLDSKGQYSDLANKKVTIALWKHLDVSGVLIGSDCYNHLGMAFKLKKDMMVLINITQIPQHGGDQIRFTCKVVH